MAGGASAHGGNPGKAGKAGKHGKYKPAKYGVGTGLVAGGAAGLGGAYVAHKAGKGFGKFGKGFGKFGKGFGKFGKGFGKFGKF